MNITINQNNYERLAEFKEILNKDESTMINAALELYFIKVQEELSQKGTNDENAMTNLDFNEFWDDIEI
ncbi:hypothetical protein [Sulfurimonas sp.]|jgi:hypothetical protein|uniref:hypothetical protein n=1 Tax=Sulfurimonas sp. TaxID=2022749 RepID=UPI0025E84F6B|nr:hypothetical protein [Sulfurimonas sp.]MBT5935779.1 hypothetical protein [Sulfurimonas sp.]